MKLNILEIAIFIVLILLGFFAYQKRPIMQDIHINEIESQIIISNDDCVVYRSYSKDLDRAIYTSKCHILIR